ncbi:MAG: YihY/virulence factor BrkB family protein [Flavobacteriales bacterium]|nr:YihY/virulence factor BrkB family protein [Flavobacteriales bacterium]
MKRKFLKTFYRLISFTKILVIPGFRGKSVYDVAIFFIESLVKGSITTRASSIAFNLFLALFPGIIFLFTLIPFIPIDGFQHELFFLLQKIFPPTTFDAAQTTINDIVNNKQGGLLSIGFIMALYFSTNGVNSLIESFNANIHIEESRSIIAQRWVSLVLTILIVFILIVAILIIIFTQGVIDFFIEKNLFNQNMADVFLNARWLILMIVIYFSISILYYLGPTKSDKLSLFSPGSVVATFFIILTSLGFSYYVDNFSQYNKLYGSIGTLIIILLWLYFNSIIFIVGFELNTSILQAVKKNPLSLKRKKKEIQ